jgi:RIO kinase 1
MRIPDSLAPLFDYGILEDVVRPLMSGKEAQVYVVVSGGKYCVAKVYKEAQNRTFKHRAEYTEGRKVRNSRDQRAIEKRSKHGRAQDEAAWRSTEVDMIHRLHAAGVRVPVPYHFIDGVLIMELIIDADGNPAPRLADLMFEPEGARVMYERLIREVLRMLSAGVVHGDFSDFNVLVGAEGPVIIDFPQSVDTAHNANARKLLLRDVENMHRFLHRFVPQARRLPYAEEMWELFQRNALTPDTRLVGRYRPSERSANTHAVLELIQEANYDERKRRESLGLRGGPPARSSTPRPPSGTYQDRQQHRPHPSSRDAQRSEPLRNNAPPPRGPIQEGPPPSHHARVEPPRHGPPRTQPPRSGSPPPRDRPRPNGPERDGSPPQNAGGRPNSNRSDARAPLSGAAAARPNGRRDEGRGIEVIVARRPPMPR